MLRTKIYMNLSEPSKLEKYKNLPFDGIGLMRIEFIITNEIGEHPLAMLREGKQAIYVDKLASSIAEVARTIQPRPVVVRFSDFKTNEYKKLKGGEEFEFDEENPMLGFRGVSRYIAEEFVEAFRLECKAIAKVRRKQQNVWVMLPFVRLPEEVPKVLALMKEEGLERSEHFKIWLMAEVPSMVIISEEFASLPIDGISIGSNDLTQLILGVDRDSALLSRMGYFDERKLPVLKALEHLIRTFNQAGKTTSICGQAPTVYPELVQFLVERGITSISVNPDAVETVRAYVAEIEAKLAKQGMLIPPEVRAAYEELKNK